MNYLILSLTLLYLLPQEFTVFSYCRESPAGVSETHCIELSSSGVGLFVRESEDNAPLEQELRLSPDGVESFRELLAATNYLEEGEQYESGRDVASLGVKTLIVLGEWGRREAVFNYSPRRDVQDLVLFFDGLVAEELLLLDIEVAMQFDRLRMPGNLDRVERALETGRLVDATRWIPILERISEDDNLLTLVRNQAIELQEEIEKKYRNR